MGSQRMREMSLFVNVTFLILPRDASTERGYEIACRLSVRLPVRPSVTFR